MIGRLARIAVIAVIAIGFVAVVALAIFRSSAFDLYTNRLDAWVKAGGSPATIQNDVIRNCGMLVMSQSGAFQNFKFLTYGRDDFDFYVDVCSKMTVNRVHKQPEFTKPEIVTALCGSTAESLFKEFCQRSGLPVAR